MTEERISAETLARWRREEQMVLLALLVVFVAFFIPAVIDARRQARDERRIEDLAQIKQQLEHFYNAHEAFPTTSADEPRRCAFSDRGTEDPVWGSTDEALRDPPLPREQRAGWPPYTYCPTAVSGTGTGQRVTSFFLQTALEHPRKEASGFDEEEGRNYRFRMFRDGSWTFYRICGGADPSCGADDGGDLAEIP